MNVMKKEGLRLYIALMIRKQNQAPDLRKEKRRERFIGWMPKRPLLRKLDFTNS